MCFLLGELDPTGSRRLVMAGNRDEFYDRPSEPPTLHDEGERAWLGPRDLRAGGTWFGVNEAGVLAALTNIPEPEKEPGSDGQADSVPSRGHLVRQVLERADSPKRAEPLLEPGALGDYRAFTLMVVGPGEIRVLSHQNGGSEWSRHSSGVFYLSNRSGFQSLGPEDDRRSPWGTTGSDIPPDRIRARLQRFSQRHEPYRERESVCVHGDRAGTVSSQVNIIQEEPPEMLYDYADGPPCETAYRSVDVPNVIREGVRRTWLDSRPSG